MYFFTVSIFQTIQIFTNNFLVVLDKILNSIISDPCLQHYYHSFGRGSRQTTNK